MKLATLCYLRQDGKTLMIHRVKKQNDIHAGKWNGLGGKLEQGETPEECARREIFEESGLTVERLQLKGVLTFPLFSAGEDWYVFVFTAHGIRGSLIDSREGDLQWVEDDKLTGLELWEGDHYFLELLKKPGIFSGKFRYENGALIDQKVEFYL